MWKTSDIDLSKTIDSLQLTEEEYYFTTMQKKMEDYSNLCKSLIVEISKNTHR